MNEYANIQYKQQISRSSYRLLQCNGLLSQLLQISWSGVRVDYVIGEFSRYENV